MQVNEVLRLGRQMKRLYVKLISFVAEEYGISKSEMDILLFLSNYPTVDTAKEIVEQRGIAKSHVSKSVDSLVKRGMLRVFPDEDDRRICHLQIQETTSPVIQKGKEAQTAFLNLLFQNISSEEKKMMEAVLRKMECNVQEALK